ncbi:MAG: magnesium transporter [Flavobacteriales bacterium]
MSETEENKQSFELDRKNLDQIRSAIEQGNDSYIKDRLEGSHAADIARVLQRLETEEAKYLFRLLPLDITADAIMELDEKVRKELLDAFTVREIADRVVGRMNSDDSADLLALLSEEKREEVISQLEDIDRASDIVDLLTYDERSAGGLMAKELIEVNVHWTVSRCIREMRKQAGNLDDVYNVYVVDDHGVLLGMLPLKELLFSASSVKTTVDALYTPRVTSVDAEKGAEEVARIMEKYDLVVLPVVNDEGKLLGRITIDDVVDVIKEEAEKDYQMASGLSENLTPTTRPLQISRSRLPWLLIGLTGGVLGAQVIGAYEEELKMSPALAFFIPLVAAMGGNVGIQSSAVVVKSIANETLELEGTGKRVLREVLVALINGAVCGLLILLYNLVSGGGMDIAYTVSLSLCSVIFLAALNGTLVPLMLHRLGADPAIATGPFITTLNDVLGVFIYFSIAALIN